MEEVELADVEVDVVGSAVVEVLDDVVDEVLDDVVDDVVVDVVVEVVGDHRLGGDGALEEVDVDGYPYRERR